jgi:pimeloyl-ACP methyl ester carboxylesterase
MRWILLLALLAFAAGCVTPERLARQIVTAPNLQRRPIAQNWEDLFAKGLGWKKMPFQSLTIYVGPPEAKLSLLELPAADYQIDFTSSIKTLPNGKHEFILQGLPRTNCPPTPVKQRGTIVVLHGYSLQKETMIPWAFVLAEAGYRVVLVDLRGHGQSTGKTFSCGKYETSDLVQALDYLNAQGVCGDKVGVLGLSFGADLGLHWAARDPRVRTVVAIAPYNRPEEAFERFAHDMKVPVTRKSLQKALALTSATLDLDWADWSGEAALSQVTEPVFLIGGDKDTISPPSDFDALKLAAPPGSRTLLVSKANHFTIGYSFEELAGPVKAWFEERL